MATLTVQTADFDGLAPSFVAADAAGDVFKFSPHTIFYVKNGGASSVDVSVVSQLSDSQGYAATDEAVTVAAGAEAVVGGLKASAFRNADGNVEITYSDVTDVTVAAIQA